jgi:hypothetical protein
MFVFCVKVGVFFPMMVYLHTNYASIKSRQSVLQISEKWFSSRRMAGTKSLKQILHSCKACGVDESQTVESTPERQEHVGPQDLKKDHNT